MKKIVTHNGRAHFDDFFASCLVLAKDDEIELIERKKPSEDELQDTSVWVLDVGEQLNPLLNNFDHHQPEYTNRVESTISLLLKEWKIWNTSIDLYPSIDTSVKIDSQGRGYIVNELGINCAVLDRLGSCLNEYFVFKFGNCDQISKNDLLFSVMKDIGKYFLETINDYLNLQEEIRSGASFEIIDGVPVISYLTYVSNKNLLYRILYQLKKERWGFGGISVVISDRPPNSISLHRYDNDPKIDFNKVINVSGVHYIHPKGFFLSAQPEIDIYKIIKIASS